MAARTATLTATERALLDATDSAMRIAEAHCNTLRRIKDMGVELGLLDRDLRAADAELKEARETFYATCRVYRQPFAVTAND